MKRGFLVSQKKPTTNARKVSGLGAPQASSSSASGPRGDVKIPPPAGAAAAAADRKLSALDKVIEYESLREDISLEQQALHNYEQREEHTKAALGALAQTDSESKVWYCAGDFFIRLPKHKAEKLAQQELDASSQAAEQTRKRIKDKNLDIQELTAM